MARQTNINVNVNSTKGVKSVSQLKKAFQELNKTVKSVGKKGKIELQVDIKGLDPQTLKQISSLFRNLNVEAMKYTKTLRDLRNVNKQVATSNKQVANSNKSVERSAKRAKKASDVFNTSLLSQAAIVGTSVRSTQQLIKSYAELESSIFAVGVSSKKNLEGIRGLKDEFLGMSTKVPFSAKALADSVTALIRTGRGYGEAKKIVEQTAKLATASGADLKSTAEVVTKVMVSFKINAEKTKDTLNSMHSTAINTASDMEFLAKSFKNVAGITSVLVSSAGKSGDALDEYKQEVLDLTMALSGSMANLGLNAGVAGTKIKMMFSKMVAGEKTATHLFDSAMRLNDVKVDGNILNFDKFSEMTKKDLPKAVELLSKLYIEGKLGTKELQKMFTTRHFMEVSDALLQVNGNVDTFVKGITKSTEYTDDFAKMSKTLSVQWKDFSNSLEKGKQTMGAFPVLMTSMTGVLSMLNESGVGEGMGFLASTSTSVVSLLAGISMLHKALPTITGLIAHGGKLVMASLVTPIGIAVASLTALTLGYGYLRQKAVESISDTNESMKRTIDLLDESDRKLSTLINSVEILKQSAGVEGIKLFDSEVVDLYNSFLESDKVKKFLDISDKMRALPNVSEASLKKAEQIKTEELEPLKNELKELRKDLDKQLSNSLDMAIRRTGVLATKDSLGNHSPEESERILRAFAKEYIEVYKAGGSPEEGQNRAVKVLDSNNAEFRFGLVHNMSNFFHVLGEPLEEFEKRCKRIMEGMHNVEESLGDVVEGGLKTLTEIDETKNQANALANVINNDNFKDFGIVEVDGTQYKGMEALLQAQQDAKSKEYRDELTKLKEKQTEEKEKLKELEKHPNQNGTAIIKIQENITKTAKEIKKNEGIIDSIIKAISATRENLKKDNLYSLKGVTRGNRLDYASTFIEKDFDKNLYNTYKDNETPPIEIKKPEKTDDRYQSGALTYLKGAKTADDVENATKTGKTIQEYQLKYVNYLKESLSLETESLKLGKLRGEQAIIDYTYKLKQLEVDKEIADKELEVAKKAMLRHKMSEQLRNQMLNVSSVKEGQTILDTFYNKNDGYMQGESGKKTKETYDAMSHYLQALAREKKIVGEIELFPIKTLRKNLDEIPILFQDSLKQIKEYSEMDGSVDKELQAKINESMQKEVEKNKHKLTTSYGFQADIKTTDLSMQNLDRMNLGKDLVENMDEEAIHTFISKIQKEFKGSKTFNDMFKLSGNARKDMSSVIAFLEKYQKDINSVLEEESKLREDTSKTEKEKVELAKENLNLAGQLLGKLGGATGVPMLGDIGNVISGFGDFSSNMKEFDFSFGDMFSDDTDKANKARNNGMESVSAGMDFGGSVGSLVAGATGGGKSAQAGGQLGGMIAGLAGLGGPAGMAVAGGMAIVGSLLEEDSEAIARKDAEKTKEANKLYNANTEALKKLAENMSSLNSGVSSLNSSMISNVSKLPTVDKLANVTGAMKDLYNTMEKTRLFNSVSYQVQKHKSGSSGFLGIGAKAARSWTETYEMSVSSLLRKYGYYKDIEQMTAEEMREFSKWLKKFDMGDTDNFSVLANAVENYAESLDKMDRNISNMFRDTTMEAFSGISSIKQEELRVQIEGFYKNLGLQITDEVSEEIDRLADEMSVMVTVTQEVRGNFVKAWRGTGTESGKAFLGAMNPYIDALLTNMSQVYYDVFYSGISEVLDKEFEKFSDVLVDLKRQGTEMSWSDVTNQVSESFTSAISMIVQAKTETESFDTVLKVLQQQALDTGLTLSELFDLNLVTDMQKTIYDTFSKALESDKGGALIAVGDMVGDKIGEAMSKRLLDNLLAEDIFDFASEIDSIMSGNLGFDSLAKVANQSLEVGLMMENERQRLEAIKDMFSFDSDIEYTTQNETVNYDSGTSQNLTQIFNVSSNLEVSNLVESDSIERLVSEIMDTLLEKLRVDKGIILE